MSPIAEPANTYILYPATNLFMTAPVNTMHGIMDVNASASLQDRTYAKIIPVKKDEKKVVMTGTFSDVPS